MFFIVFEWGRILESAMDKYEVKCNARLRPNYFSVNISVLVVVFRRQISKTLTILPEIAGFFKFVGKIQQLVWKRSLKNI